VNDQKFIASGKSKRLAKQAVAEKALESFLQFKNEADTRQAMGRPAVVKQMDIDFTSDVSDFDITNFDPNAKRIQNEQLVPRAVKPLKTPNSGLNSVPTLKAVESRTPTELPSDEKAGPSCKPVAMTLQQQKQAKLAKISPLEKNPVTILNELVPGTKFECIAESGEANSKFTMAVTVEGQLFKGSGDYNYFFLTETLGY